jgi:hypothetical protein
MLKFIAKFLKGSSQWLCDHRWIRKIDRDESHAYLECIKCLKRTPGISLYGDRVQVPAQNIYRK